MRTFSDAIITPETLLSSIDTAFHAQNDELIAEIKRIHKPILITLVGLAVVNVITTIAFIALVI